jgi:hypothetical protein
MTSISMKLNVENKSPYFYKLERLLLGGHSDWFYLYLIDFNLETSDLLIEIGPNTIPEDRRKWLFTDVTNFSVANDDESNNCEFPKMIFGIDLHKHGVAVIACDDSEYAFEIVKMPTQVY